jgi:tetratricopeptide (TPR) repeat protein
MHTRFFFFLWLFLSACGLSAQTATDLQLAQYYYNNAEFDKALGYYEKIYVQDQSKAIFLPYLTCLLDQNDTKTAEKVLRKQISLNKKDYEVRLLAGQFYEDQDDPNKARKIYDELLSELGPNPGQTIAVYQAFAAKGMLVRAKQTLDIGQKLSPSYPFNFQYADYFAMVGDKRSMLGAYLDYLAQQPSVLPAIQQAIGSRLDLTVGSGPDYILAKEVLLQRAQQLNAPIVFNQMLIWLCKIEIFQELSYK